MGRYDLHEDEAPVYNMNITGAEFPPITVDAAARIRSELSSRKTEYVQECIKMQKDRETAAERVEEGKAFVTELLASAPEERMDFYRDLFVYLTSPTRTHLNMFVTIRQAISGVLTQIADDHLLVTNQPVTDQAQHARWFLNAIKTLQFSGLLISNLRSQTQHIAAQFPNLEHIKAGTYVVNIELAFRASETRNPNAHHQLVTDYFESQRSKKGKPLRLRDNDGRHMEPIRKRAERVTPAAWRGAPGRPAKVKTEIILYFVDKHELSDTHHRGILATYDVFAEEVTSTELVDFYRQNAFDMPGESRNNWSNPDSWLIFRLDEYKEVARHATKKEKRNRRE